MSAVCNATASDAEPVTTNVASLITSYILMVAGAAVLAFSMVVQRYGLADWTCSLKCEADDKIQLCSCSCHRLLVWFVGILLYGAANGLKVTAFNLGPLSVLGSLFSIVLVFNLLFARLLLKEALTWPKIVSSLVILTGAIICTVGSPTEVRTVFTPLDILALMEKNVGFVVVITAIMLVSLGGIIYTEKKYPAGEPKPGGAPHDPPPPKLALLMALVYPGALGLDEALADLLIKGWSAMFSACAGGRACADCNHPIVYLFVGFWVLLSFGGSLVWMPVVYRRYEVSIALPVEYGAVNAGAVLAALLFYDEWQYMEAWQLTMQIVGCIIILGGIGILLIKPKTGAGAGSHPKVLAQGVEAT